MVLLFAIAAGLSVANVYYAQPLLDALAQDFGISNASVGVVVTATQIGCALALVFVVPLGDLINRRRLVLAQLACLVLASAGVAQAPSANWLLVGMLAVGLLGTAMTQGLIAYAASVAAPTERGSVVGVAQSGVVIGLLLARTVSGGVADLAGWRAVYGTAGIVAVLMWAVLYYMLPVASKVGDAKLAEPLPSGLRKASATKHSSISPTAPTPAHLASDGTESDMPTPSPSRSGYWALILSTFSLIAHDRVLQTRGVLALLMFAAFNIFWTALVLPLSAPPYALSHTQIGAFGLVGAVGALAAARAGYWADRGAGQRTTGIALGLMLLSWLLMAGLSHSLWWLIIGIVLLDLGGQAIHVTNQSMIFSAQSGDAHSRMVAGYMLFYAVGSGLGAIASTAVFAVAGWAGVCLLGAGVTVAALAFWKITVPRGEVRRLS
ncbi:MFS transporter [Pigmentiphaga aceris]|nr:MFS transporter [Pigmentiphaga aceris]